MEKLSKEQQTLLERAIAFLKKNTTLSTTTLYYVLCTTTSFTSTIAQYKTNYICMLTLF